MSVLYYVPPNYLELVAEMIQWGMIMMILLLLLWKEDRK